MFVFMVAHQGTLFFHMQCTMANGTTTPQTGNRGTHT
jgi:hypothetical protein